METLLIFQILITTLTPTILYYFLIRKELKSSVIFGLIFGSISDIVGVLYALATLNLFGLEILIKPFAIFNSIIISIASLYIALWLMKEKVSFKTIVIITAVIIAELIFFMSKIVGMGLFSII